MQGWSLFAYLFPFPPGPGSPLCYGFILSWPVVGGGGEFPLYAVWGLSLRGLQFLVFQAGLGGHSPASQGEAGINYFSTPHNSGMLGLGGI